MARVRRQVRSAGTYRIYRRALIGVARRIGVPLRAVDADAAVSYLLARGREVGQKSLDIERCALQTMLRAFGGLGARQALRGPDGRVPQGRAQHLVARAYTPAQVDAIAARQAPHNVLATRIAHAAGLRAHELLTLRPPSEQPPDDRRARQQAAIDRTVARLRADGLAVPADTRLEALKFAGREGVVHTVAGKGGLVREVLLPRGLARRLEDARLDVPVRRVDMAVNYVQHYAVGGGNAFSSSFTRASLAALGRSGGAHGLRHAYAQLRLRELGDRMPAGLAKLIVSFELGHHRADVTETYLR